MTRVVEVFERPAIERFARRDAALHLYALGDLDPFFWPHTRWFGLMDPAGELQALALLYTAGDPTVLLALGRDDDGALAALLPALHDRLPLEFYAHLSPGLVASLRTQWSAAHCGRHLKMLLTTPAKLLGHAVDDVVRLGSEDHDALAALYARAYPGNWFDARMLHTGQYFGIRDGERIVCVAGVHVYSPQYRVAALGNVTTDPAWRGRGMARRATARLCAALSASVDTIGLNVEASNAAAIACYRALGFEVVAEYDEWMFTPLGADRTNAPA